MLETWIQRMQKQAPDMTLLRNERLAPYTTFGIGGPADVLADPASVSDVQCALREAAACGVPLTLLGNGSNVLVRDGGVRGAVLRIGARLARVTDLPDGFRAEAGVPLSALAQSAMRRCLGGMAELSGIPGTLGGACAMNAGAYGGEMTQVVSRVECVTRTGECRSYDHDAAAFRYRGSAMLDAGDVVTRVEIRLSPAPAEEIAARMAELARTRRDKQPIQCKSAGSFFKRPEGGFAAALIDAAGLKGAAVGDACVSTLHAGFLLNAGHATAADMLALMRRVQETVYAQSGVTLEPEVRIIGED